MSGDFITKPLRVVRWDLVGRSKGWRRLARKLLAALIAFALVVALRELVDLWVPKTAPYALAYPGLLIATLMGRLRGGLIAWVLIFGYLWLTAIHHGPNFSFADPQDAPRTAINVVVGLLVVLVAESARASAAALLSEREQRLAERDMLLAEFDHRLKNNLTILSSLIAMQAREAENPAVVEALGKAASRVTSLGRTYDHLRFEHGAIQSVNLDQLIESLTNALRESLIAGSPIELVCQSCPCTVDRDRASALALLINELVTNAVKHAFVGRSSGRVEIDFAVSGSDGQLRVSDDGVGIPAESPAGRQGMRLLKALAKMAQGDLSVSSSSSGTQIRVRLRDIVAA